MRSASSADRSAICVTFSLPHENAAELQNMARSCAERLRDLGVLALQVGNSTAISLQSTSESACRSVNSGGTRDRRQQSLNATRTNVARYLGADISTLPPAACCGNGTVQRNSLDDRSAAVSVSTSVSLEQHVNMVAESSPHIVNLLQHDILSGSTCLPSSVPMSPAGDARPKKRARRKAASVVTEISVPSTPHGTAEHANSVYSSQQALGYADPSTDVPVAHYAEEFKIPVSRRRKPCASRKNAVAKSQQPPIAGQALSTSKASSFGAGFSECSKASEVGMFQATAACNVGSFQMNGVSPYHRIPVMNAGWQAFPAHSAPSSGLYQFPPRAAPYPGEYGHHRFRFAGNVSYSHLPANGSRVPVPDLVNYRNVTPSSPSMFVPNMNMNQTYLKEEQVHSVVPQKPLHWLSPAESQTESVPYGANSTLSHRIAPDRSRCLPMSHVVQRSFVAHHPDTLTVPDDSRQCAETVASASEKMVSADIERLKLTSMPVCGAVSTNCVTGEHVNMPPSLTYQRANGLLADVHSTALVLSENVGHLKMNGELDYRQPTSTSSAVTESPYASLASSTTASVIDTNCFPERPLQQPSVQLPMKSQHYSVADFDLNGCSAGTVPDTVKVSALPGADGGLVQSGQYCYATQDDASL